MSLLGIPDEPEIDRAIAVAKAAADEVVTRAVTLFATAGAVFIADLEKVIHTELADLKAWVETLGIDVSVDVVRRPK